MSRRAALVVFLMGFSVPALAVDVVQGVNMEPSIQLNGVPNRMAAVAFDTQGYVGMPFSKYPRLLKVRVDNKGCNSPSSQRISVRVDAGGVPSTTIAWSLVFSAPAATVGVLPEFELEYPLPTWLILAPAAKYWLVQEWNGTSEACRWKLGAPTAADSYLTSDSEGYSWVAHTGKGMPAHEITIKLP